MRNKKRLVKYIKNNFNVVVPQEALFDIMVKRIHEYKRQLLNILYVIWRYRQLKGMSDEEKLDQVPRVVIFGGKAAPGYYMAKMTIKLINTVAEKINNDPDVTNLLYCIFIPDYNVSIAEMLMPASDISQHISTAGMEASGTGNMKFTMNGGIILGTMDGANIELAEHIGQENMYIFGTLAENVDEMRKEVKKKDYVPDPSFTQLMTLLKDGYIGTFPELNDIINTVTNGNDWYLVSVDWPQYLEAQRKIDEDFKDKNLWTKKSILATAGSGYFSSDRSIKDYAEKIWGIEPFRRPGPVPIDIDKVSEYVEVNPMNLGASPGVSTIRLSFDDEYVIKSFSPNPRRYNL